MRRSVLIAAVGSVLALASFSQAAFTISSAPAAGATTGVNAPAVVGSGRFALNLFVANDAGGTDGSAIQAIKLVFAGTGGTKAYFSAFGNTTVNPDPNGDPIPVPNSNSADVNNFNPQYTSILDRNSSNLRLAGAATTYVDNPGDADSALTDDQATNGVTNFNADYAVLSAAASIPSSGANVRFARLVFNTATPTFTLSGSVAGESGTASAFTYTFPTVVGTNTPPVIVAPPTTVTFGTVVTNGKTFSANVVVNDAEGGLITLTGAAPASVTGLTITPGSQTGTSLNFTVSGTVAYGPFGSIVNIPLTATDSAAGSTTTPLVLTLVPEPTTLAALGAAGLGLIRRRK